MRNRHKMRPKGLRKGCYWAIGRPLGQSGTKIMLSAMYRHYDSMWRLRGWKKISTRPRAVRVFYVYLQLQILCTMTEKIVVLTGAGISAESGISTFRDSDGLWEHYRVEDVATHAAYERNPELVLDFYNQRRRQLFDAQPNEAHRQLVRLEQRYDVQIVTQNIDDLHERAGSKHVLHLHGELTKGRSDVHPDMIVDIGRRDIKLGDLAPDGTQLRPHIVWFGEAVPNIEPAAELCEQADIFIVVGTSMAVYPAAGLIHYVPRSARCYVVDPKEVPVSRQVTFIKDVATRGVTKLVNNLMQ